jgi:YesN/AraC family two-component response regulator
MTPSDAHKILERLARIEEKLDQARGHEERLRRIERWQAGLAAVVMLLVIELQAVGVFVAVSRGM